MQLHEKLYFRDKFKLKLRRIVADALKMTSRKSDDEMNKWKQNLDDEEVNARISSI